VSGSDADVVAHGRRLAALEMKMAKLYEHLQIGEPDPDASDLPPEVQQLLLEGRDVEAIRAYREQMGVGLAEAHDAVHRHGKGG
jgi:ribosomal protein L7/L12